MDEIQGIFVDDPRFASSKRRPLIWSNWLDANAMVSSVIPILCMWVSGSFLTSKPEPDDVDCVYWVDDQHLPDVNSDPTRARLLQSIAQGGLQAQGINVDAFVLPWHMFHGSPTDPDSLGYLRNRGYWDDLWLRRRSGPKGAPSVRSDSFPRRGYLEVMVNGWV